MASRNSVSSSKRRKDEARSARASKTSNSFDDWQPLDLSAAFSGRVMPSNGPTLDKLVANITSDFKRRQTASLIPPDPGSVDSAGFESANDLEEFVGPTLSDETLNHDPSLVKAAKRNKKKKRKLESEPEVTPPVSKFITGDPAKALSAKELLDKEIASVRRFAALSGAEGVAREEAEQGLLVTALGAKPLKRAAEVYPELKRRRREKREREKEEAEELRMADAKFKKVLQKRVKRKTKKRTKSAKNDD